MKNLTLFMTLSLTAIPALAGDPPAIHGMLMVGKQTIYLSHLPMFHSPHNYQALFEAEPTDTARGIYVRDKERSGEKVYTIVPEPFVLTDLTAGRKSFKADIYRGHFERGGTKIAAAVRFEIVKVVYFRKFNPRDRHPQQPEYLAFGKGAEVFLAHIIRSAPDFDQILTARLAPAASDERLSSALSLTLPAGLAIGLDGLRDGQATSASLPDGSPVALQVGEGLYHETGDLE